MHKIIICLLGLGLAGQALGETPERPSPSRHPVTFQAYVGGYGYWSNAPLGSVEITYPILHRFAGGMGSFSNPITMAVGHRVVGGEVIPDIAPGTVLYLPRLRKYAIVEDICEDNDSPQDSPCHRSDNGLPRFEIYVDGVSANEEMSLACIKAISGPQPLVMDPGPNMSVVVGPLTESGCFIFPDP